MNPNRVLGIAILSVLFIGPVAALIFRIPMAYTLSFMAAFIAITYGVAKYRWDKRREAKMRRATDAFIEQQIEEQKQERESHGA